MKEKAEVETFLEVVTIAAVFDGHSGLTWMEGKNGIVGDRKERLGHFHGLAEEVGG